jgi:hypothetical protein
MLGFIGAPALGPGWVRVREVQPGPRLGWVLGRDLRPMLGYAEVYLRLSIAASCCIDRRPRFSVSLRLFQVRA